MIRVNTSQLNNLLYNWSHTWSNILTLHVLVGPFNPEKNSYFNTLDLLTMNPNGYTGIKMFTGQEYKEWVRVSVHNPGTWPEAAGLGGTSAWEQVRLKQCGRSPRNSHLKTRLNNWWDHLGPVLMYLVVQNGVVLVLHVKRFLFKQLILNKQVVTLENQEL